MAVLRLDYVTRDKDRHGNVRYYFRRPGKKKLRLRGQPGSEEFMAAYAAALAGEKAEAEPRNKSLDWLCDRYFKSATFLALEDYTKRRKRTVLNQICDITFGEAKAARRLGTLPFEGMSKANVRKLRDMRADAPEAANFRLKQISALFSWAVVEEHAKVDPPKASNASRMRARAFIPGPSWTFSPLSAIIRSERSRAFPWRFCCWLGVPGDRTFHLAFWRLARERRLDLLCAVQGPEEIAADYHASHPTAFAAVHNTPLGKETYLETAYGKPFTAPGFGNWFRTQCQVPA